MNAKKRTSLAAVFGTDDLQVHVPLSPKRAGDGEDGVGGAGQRSETVNRFKRPGVKQHTAYLPLPIHEQLRKLAFEENRKMHTYLLEGLDRVFADRGLPAIKDLSK